MNRTIRIILSVILLAACIFHVSAQVSATPYDHPNTHVNTGNQRADIVSVALTQVGYLEGNNNDTKYGQWYGLNNVAWCGIFVAWCADQAGVPTSVLARTGVASPASYGLTAQPRGYVPQSGDLFFATDRSHVGLVYYVEGDHFYSVEGNTWENSGAEGVYIRKHTISDYIFASPDYQGQGDHSYVLTSETEHPHKEYYKCTDCDDFYYTGELTSRSDCITCIQASCTHSYGQWTMTDGSQHGRTCSLCGKEESGAHSWDSGTVNREATCTEPGEKTQQCTLCGHGRTVSTEKTAHSYTPWEAKDDSGHVRSCTLCQTEQTEYHDGSGGWKTDEAGHWRECAVCGLLFEAEGHSFGQACDSPCELCGYTSPEGHHFSEELSYDGSGHWRSCTGCETRENTQPHSFSAECAEQCDSCAYTRTTSHSYHDGYITDESGHWYECKVCGIRDREEAHTASKASRPGAIQYCTVCQLQLTAEEDHTHSYDTVYSNEASHWGSCECGRLMEEEPHSWSVQTQRCSVCGAVLAQPKTEDPSNLLPWIAGAAAVLTSGIAVTVLLLVRKKRSGIPQSV